jgi:hypothetical protein
MTRNFIYIVFSSICSMGILCAADEYPNELIAFLAPEMKVGIDRDFKSTEDSEIHIWSELRFQMELDARRLPFVELAEKYPTVAEAAEKERARTATHRNEEHLETIWRPQYSPMNILHVGKDYVLLQSAEDADSRVAIPVRRIAQVRWGATRPVIGITDAVLP